MKKRPNQLIARYDAVRNRTCITSQYATYPVRFIQVDNERDCSHVYLLGYGGGLVAGDINIIHMKVEQNAMLCLRTQGSTKVYKALRNKLERTVSNSSHPTSNDGTTKHVMECCVYRNAMVCVILFYRDVSLLTCKRLIITILFCMSFG